ncbi:uncharacterized protein METZ01_LOCUS494720, partial [marine metagenome]
MTHSELPITASNLTYVEELYAQYVENPDSVEERWRAYFASMDDDAGFADNPRLGPAFAPSSLFNGQVVASPDSGGNGHASKPGMTRSEPVEAAPEVTSSQAAALQDRLIQLVRA